MGRWTAPSDLDYLEEQQGGYDGIERTCRSCGEPVMVSRSEAYTVHIFCDRCLEAMDAAKERRERKAMDRR